MAVEKCDPYREGYADCASYLTGTGRWEHWEGVGDTAGQGWVLGAGTGQVMGAGSRDWAGYGCWDGGLGRLWVLGGDTG